MDPSRIGGPPHQPTESIDLPGNDALGHPTDGGIAAHLSDSGKIRGDQKSPTTQTGGGRRGLRPGMPAPDHHNVIPLVHHAVGRI